MAHNLKLAIYQFTVRKKHKKERLNFNDVFKVFSSTAKKKDDLYKEFADLYLQSFNGRFAKSSDRTKSIVPIYLKYQSRQNLVHGMLKGGLTDIEREIYDSSDSTKPVGNIKKTNITTLPYFFLLWTPVDLDYGVLMIHHYSSTSVSTPLIENLKGFFGNQELTFTTYPYVPKKLKEKFVKSSTIKKLALINRKLSEDVRSKFQPLVTDEDEFEIVLELRKLNKNPGKFKENIDKIKSSARKLFQANLNDLGIEDEKDYEMRIYYEDDKGKKSHAKLSNNFDILPTIDIPDSIKEPGKDSPDPDLIKKYCINLLNSIKKELNNE